MNYVSLLNLIIASSRMTYFLIFFSQEMKARTELVNIFEYANAPGIGNGRFSRTDIFQLVSVKKKS